MPQTINIADMLLDSFLLAAESFWWLPVIAVLSGILRTSWFKGWLGEWLVSRTLTKIVGKNSASSFIFNDVLLATQEGTTQVDHVLLTSKGLFVIETKNMKGWIFGSAQQKRWTQQIYRHKSSFQNPLHQNYKHTQTLRALLDLDSSVVRSIVVFMGGAQFKTPMPINVIKRHELASYINGIKETVFTPNELVELNERLSQGKIESSFAATRNHVKHVKGLQQSMRVSTPADRLPEKKEVITEPVSVVKEGDEMPTL